ncbi:GSCFA domain-containing protein [Roseivirga sp. BDSF3-8]|uniref:GSCFA domain-containing protein n=1 Tax=Roseivirga sp. BDSF3-8 TaxID=3241598 RepID=UPI0035321D5A
MRLRTEVHPGPAPSPIHPGQRILSIGSCFADCMGLRLQDYKFPTLANPFGVLFNPLSISKLLCSSLNGSSLSESGLIERNGLYFHYDLHSSFHSQYPEELLDAGNKALQQTGKFLRNTDHLILTLGTAFVYYHLTSGQAVANCHKVPAATFEKKLLSVPEVEGSLNNLLKCLKDHDLNPAITVTVSPIRHIKDTATLNTVSKSTLRLAAHYLATKYTDIRYFPSYEIMMDDLRDYRFYREDMLHPTSQAEQYIWDIFTHTTFTEEGRNFAREWSKIRSALAHRPLNPGSKEHISFLNQTIGRLKGLESYADTSKEIAELEKRLNEYGH